MATKTFYIKNLAVPSSGTPDVKYVALQDGGTAPSTANLANTGWNLNITSLGMNYDAMGNNPLLQIASGGQSNVSLIESTIDWTNPVKGFRSESPLTCDIAAGVWNFSFSMIATTAASGSGKLRFRIWKSTMSSFPGQVGGVVTGTDLTSTTGSIETGLWSNMTTSTAQNLTASISLPLIELRNEYLYIHMEHQTTVINNSTSATIVFRTDATNSKITTPSFTDYYNNINLKNYSSIEQSSVEYDNNINSVEKLTDIKHSTSEFENTLNLKYVIDSTSSVTYYAMRGKDNISYKTWVVTDAPDVTGSQYTGQITGTMMDIVVLKVWSV